MKTVALVGRVNVGKSTLFNRLIEKPKAIVSPIPGTTRDRAYGECLWRGQRLKVIDTGGLEVRTKTEIEKAVRVQVEFAIKESDLLIFILDIQKPLTAEDKFIAGILRASGKPVIIALNKADNPKIRARGIDPGIAKLGLGDIFLVSAANGSGVGDLLDGALEKLKEEEVKGLSEPEAPSRRPEEAIPPVERPIKIAIIGRPNVGKSSLVNALLGEERVIVSEVPFTTREPQDTFFTYRGQPLILVDTAGIRKKAKIAPGTIEKMGVKRSLEALKRSDVIILIVEAHERIGRQDKRLASLIVEYKKPAVLVANKWDLVSKAYDVRSTKLEKEYEKYFKGTFPHLSWAPLIFISAKYDAGVKKVLDLALAAFEESQRVLSHEELNMFLKEIISKEKLIPFQKTRLRQVGKEPPQFRLEISRKFRFPSPEKFLAKRLRQKFGFTGTPILVNIKLS